MREQSEFKRLEFEVEARCIHCGALLFQELAVDERNAQGSLVEVERQVTGDGSAPPTCKCRSK